MKLRNLVTDGSLSLLQDIIRGFVTDPDLGEKLSHEILNMDMLTPSVDHRVAQTISLSIAAGTIQAGFMSSLLQFIVSHHPDTNPVGKLGEKPKKMLPAPRLHELPWSAGTDAYDFFLFLYEAPRTKNQVLSRWDRKVVDRLWEYFRDGRMDAYGYRVELGRNEGKETVQLILCETTTTKE